MSHYFYITPEEYAAAEENGISPALMNERVQRYGWKKDRAINTPVRVKSKLKVDKRWIEIAKDNGICYGTFHFRVKKLGWCPERAATQPLQDREAHAKLMRDRYDAKNPKATKRRLKEYEEMAKENGIAYSTFCARVRKGMDFEKAATTPIMPPRERGLIGAIVTYESGWRKQPWARLLIGKEADWIANGGVSKKS